MTTIVSLNNSASIHPETKSPVNAEQLRNQYLRIELSSRTEPPNFVYVKLGDVIDQENYAAYNVELEDWAGLEVDRYLPSRMTLSGRTTATLSYVAACRAKVITEKEFHSGVVDHIVQYAKAIPPGVDAYTIHFKRTDIRGALMSYLMEHGRVNGLVL